MPDFRFKCLLLALGAYAVPASGGAPGAAVSVDISGLRSSKGAVHVCLTRTATYFPDCGRDPAAIKRTVRAAEARSLNLSAIPTGTYALSVFHDENGNQRLDTFLKIPKEGFGFSRNPHIRMGPPRFEETRFSIVRGIVVQSVRITYML